MSIGLLNPSGAILEPPSVRTMLSLYKIDPIQDPRWGELVNAHPLASVFHTIGWLEALQRTYGYRPIVFTTSSPAGKLQNGLVFCRIRSWITGQRMVSLPFSDHCEPLVNSSEELDFLVGCMQAEMDHQEWRYLEFRPANGSFNPIRAEGDFRAAKLYYLHRMDLRPTTESLFQGFHKDSVQRRIRHAERANLLCECGRSGKLLKDFYGLMVLTRSRHHLPPQPYAWFRNLIDCMGGSLEIRVAYKERIPTDAILTLRFRNAVYYKYGCSNRKFKDLGATTLLLWNAIQDAKATGAEVFDFGRSEIGNKGLIAFKDHWTEGHTSMAYWRYPSSTSLVPSESRRLKLAKHVFAWMPRGLLTMTGELIYRHIG